MTKKDRYYFNADTQAAIAEHQRSETSTERERIYVSRIHPAFDKLVENLINIHRFVGPSETHEDLKNECTAFLYETIHKFDPNRGTNAFSYFNIVAKHWLIIHSKKRTQRMMRSTSLDDQETLSARDMELIAEHIYVPAQDDIIEAAEKSKMIIALLEDIRDRLVTDNELLCIDSVILLFKMANDIDLLGKSAVLTYLREMTALSPKQLTAAMFSIKRHYRELREEGEYDLLGDI